MPGGHAFISYVREDAERVNRLEAILKAAGVSVWRDTADLWPGDDWRMRIREAIVEDAFAFIACFSETSEQKVRSGQNEELNLAVDQLRQRRPDQPWLIPVRLDNVDVPDLDIGGGRTLRNLQRVDLFDERWDTGVGQLVAGVLRILGSPSAGPATPAPPSQVANLKRLLRDPNGDIAVEELVLGAANAAVIALDPETLPTTRDVLEGDAVAQVRIIVARADRYVAAVEPLSRLLVAGCTWGRPDHELAWTSAVARVGNAPRARGGMATLIELQDLPLIPVVYAGAIAAIHRGNFGALRSITIDPLVRVEGGTAPAVTQIHPWMPFRSYDYPSQVMAYRASGTEITDEWISEMIGNKVSKRFTPVSNFLEAYLRPMFGELIPDARDYTDAFDRAEVLLGVLAADERLRMGHGDPYVHGAWFGAFTWRDQWQRDESQQIERRMWQELTSAGPDAPPLLAGLFDGDVDRANAAFADFVKDAAEARHRRF